MENYNHKLDNTIAAIGIDEVDLRIFDDAINKILNGDEMLVSLKVEAIEKLLKTHLWHDVWLMFLFKILLNKQKQTC